MSITAYSIVLSVMSLGLAGVTILSILGYFFSEEAKERLKAVPYGAWMGLIGLLAGFSIVGALIYQYEYLTLTCSLCWWQRIFIFPIALVASVALYTRSKTEHLTTALLAVFGLIFALYHYSGHFQKFVLGNSYIIPCSSSALEPSCSESPIVIFGFITIPLMGIIALVAILWLSYLAHQKAKSEQRVV